MSISLINGDCLVEMGKLPDESIDLILTDLPYGVTAAAGDSKIDLDRFFAESLRVIKPQGVIALFAQDPFSSQLIHACPKHYRFKYVWVKNNAANFLRASVEPLKFNEDILIFTRTGNVGVNLTAYTYNPQKQPMDKAVTRTLPAANSHKLIRNGKNAHYYEADGFTQREDGRYIKTYSEKTPSNILYFPRDHSSKLLLPFQKPVDLLKYLIRTFSHEADTVLDATMGSGSTGVACFKTKRKFIGIELEKAHFDVAHKRIFGLSSDIKWDELTPQSLGAYKTHLKRAAEREKSIKSAIIKAKRQNKKVTKTLIASMTNMTRSHLTTRYGYLFDAA